MSLEKLLVGATNWKGEGGPQISSQPSVTQPCTDDFAIPCLRPDEPCSLGSTVIAHTMWHPRQSGYMYTVLKPSQSCWKPGHQCSYSEDTEVTWRHTCEVGLLVLQLGRKSQWGIHTVPRNPQIEMSQGECFEGAWTKACLLQSRYTYIYKALRVECFNQ